VLGVITNTVIFSVRQHIGVYAVAHDTQCAIGVCYRPYVCLSVRHTGGSL